MDRLESTAWLLLGIRHPAKVKDRIKDVLASYESLTASLQKK